jgi:hypothetical protein
MSFLELFLSSYGLRRGGGKKPSVEDLRDPGGKDVCAKMDDKKACEAKLIGSSGEDDQLHRDGIRWLWEHIDLLRLTQADTSHSRLALLLRLARSVPGWLWYPLVIVMIIAGIFGLMMLAIVARSFKNPIIMVKLLVLGGFSFAVMTAYLLLPV